MRYVVIGGGIAGTTAAEELRKLDEGAEITIIEAEQHRLYSRVLLPHYVDGKIDRDKCFLKKPEWYAEKNIEFMPGVRVLEIDVKNQFVRTSEERELPFDKLLVTTGGDLRLVGEDMRGVSYLRSLDDADHLIQLINEVKTLPEDERRAVIYGGGFIALEYLNIFEKHGIEATLVMRSGGFWSRILSPASQEVMRKHVESRGVRVMTDVKNISLVGETELSAVRAGEEELPAKIIGAGIGIVADHALFEAAGFDHNAGLLANEYLETSAQNVYTAGDVAEFLDTVSGRQVIHGNWMNAIMQGRVVAKTMAGERTPFELVSSYATDFLDKDVAFVGDTSREHADEVEQFLLEEDAAIELFHREGKTIGAVMIGDVSQRQAITNAIKNNERYAG